MKKGIIVAVGLACLVPQAVVRAEMSDMSNMSDMHKHMGHDSQYCEKHCRTMDLRKEVQALDQEIAKDKAAGKAVPGGKMIEMQNRAKAVREHLAKHEKELADAHAELDKAEAELKQMEGK